MDISNNHKEDLYNHQHPYCPTNEIDCPYCDKDCICKMYDKEGCLPYDECDCWAGLDEYEPLTAEQEYAVLDFLTSPEYLSWLAKNEYKRTNK